MSDDVKIWMVNVWGRVLVAGIIAGAGIPLHYSAPAAFAGLLCAWIFSDNPWRRKP